MKFRSTQSRFISPPMERKWARHDNFGSTAYKTRGDPRQGRARSAVVPIPYVLINDGVNDSIRGRRRSLWRSSPLWNAAVCKGDVGRLNVGGPGGAGADSAASLVAQVPVLAVLKAGPR